MVEHGKNYLVSEAEPLSIPYTSTLFVNSVEQPSGPGSYSIETPGFFSVVVDGIPFEFATLTDSNPEVGLVDLFFEGSTDRFWKEMRGVLADGRIYDKSEGAYPLFKGITYALSVYAPQACFVKVLVDDTDTGLFKAPVSGDNLLHGMSFERGQHKIQVKADLSPLPV